MEKNNIIYLKSINNSYDSINSFYLKNNLKTYILNKSNINNLGCLLIIKTGTYNEKIKGLAHLLEHVLYSNKDYFDKIRELSEDLNGFTSNLYTGYYFTSNNKEIFFKTIKYFSNLFINPNFDKDTILNEIENINSEYLLKKSNNNYIYNNLLQLNIIDDYNYKFSIGNKDTLLYNNICFDLKNFFDNYYYAENMNLFIFNNDINIIDDIKLHLIPFEFIKSSNLSNLSNLLINNNLDIKNNKEEINKEEMIIKDKIIIKEKNKCYKININNSKKTGTIILFYTINLKLFNFSYFYFLKELINKNSYNSLFNILKSNNLISSLNFNINDIIKDYVIIRVEFKQTHYGTKHEDLIITSFYKYLEFLKQNINENYYNIFKNCYKIKYIYQNKINDVIDYILSINYKLNNSIFINEEIDKLLDCEIIYDKFDKNNFNSLIDELDIKNSMTILNNYKYSNFKYETKYFNTKFLIDDNNFIINNDINFNFKISYYFINNNTINKINSLNLNQNLLLNNKEKFYFNNNNILIYSNPNNILDEKIFIKIEFTLNNVYDNIYNYFYFCLFIFILGDKLKFNLINEYLYGFNFNFNINKNKLYLSINGFNFNINNIFFYILNFIYNYHINNNDFYKYKQDFTTFIINQDKKDFFYKINKHMNFILFDEYFLLKNHIHILNDLKFINHYKLNISNLIFYIHSKYNISNLLSIISFFNNLNNKNNKNNTNNTNNINNIKIKDKEIFKFKKFEDIYDKYLIKSNDKDNYIIDNILIIDNINYKKEVIIDMIKEIIDKKFFEEFRRKKHYGYICKVLKNIYGYKNHIITLDFIINVSKDNIQKIDLIKKEVLDFINIKLLDIINLLNLYDLDNYKHSLINKYLNDKNIDDNIFNSLLLYDLKYYDNLINICKNISKNDIINFISNLLNNKKLLLLIIN